MLEPSLGSELSVSSYDPATTLPLGMRFYFCMICLVWRRDFLLSTYCGCSTDKNLRVLEVWYQTEEAWFEP